MVAALCFYLFAFLLILSALMVVTARNPVHSVLFLIFAFFNASGLMILLGAEFIGLILAIVYVGAVAVLFLFVVMMLDVDFAGLRKGGARSGPFGFMIGAALLFQLGFIYTAWQVRDSSRAAIASPDTGEAATNTHALGRILYTDYVFAFQLSGLVLLVAMIGAITLTLRHRPNVRRQDIGRQLATTKKDAVEIRKVKTGQGV